MGAIRSLGLAGLCLLTCALVARGDQPGQDQSNGSTVPWWSQQRPAARTDQAVRRAQAPGQPAAGAPAPAPAQPGALSAPGQPGGPAAPAPAPPAGTPIPAAPGPVASTATAANVAEEVETATAGNLTVDRPPIMLGDSAPLLVRQALAAPPTPVPGQPPIPGNPRFNRAGVAAIPSWVRGFKIADDMSPRPQDRVFFSFNYYNDLGGDVNHRLGDQVRNIQVYRYMLGMEKTFLDGRASIGIRMPIDALTATSSIPGLGGTHSAVDSLTVFSKLMLWEDSNGSLVSTGLAVTVPNGPSNFAGSPAAPGFRDTQLQPFIGYIWQRGRFYVQGFESVGVPLDPNDVTMLYNDVGIGYFVYQSQNPNAFLTGIVPTFETHVNLPMNHQGSLRINDLASTPNVVDLTFGTSFVFGRRAIATFAFVDPVTGPKPFDFEVLAFLNIFFGRTAAARPPLTPPAVGL